ncbi:uncharacterized protein MEPE_06607 [Melanopsichium pennsylvanicum]|uniref:Uncharacterized protein n=2 Tax=Melanopsichium pennsylvanicum TaxID=63383 RepID=A0AAJ4XTI9_9BASI|nr:uncharacterized protein MEPE_06607 [Melanopsichium pennsylvanicum]
MPQIGISHAQDKKRLHYNLEADKINRKGHSMQKAPFLLPMKSHSSTMPLQSGADNDRIEAGSQRGCLASFADATPCFEAAPPGATSVNLRTESMAPNKRPNAVSHRLSAATSSCMMGNFQAEPGELDGMMGSFAISGQLNRKDAGSVDRLKDFIMSDDLGLNTSQPWRQAGFADTVQPICQNGLEADGADALIGPFQLSHGQSFGDLDEELLDWLQRAN